MGVVAPLNAWPAQAETTPISDSARVAEIAARMDLREPNQQALESIAMEIGQHFEIDGRPPPFEAVVDVATGVGKTYIMAAAIEYLVQDGVRNFAVIAPGRTILNKTVNNFTLGHPKSLLPSMSVRPVVITAENFATAAMRAVMDDETQVKLFIFTVQSLLKPKTKVGRRTHEFQEGLGEAFYEHLQSLGDLHVFADEHHAYYGAAFSKAVRDLSPKVLIGLTATPSRRAAGQIIYRYPLAAAIADRLVKTPVLVGRRDDRKDTRTKLVDGIQLLELKEGLMKRWQMESGDKPVTPIMLVVAESIKDADEVGEIAASPELAQGRYEGKVLVVHSNAPEEALAALDRLELPDNPYRIVVSVGMLKEGWDVKNVYVICSLRASISEVLTEQTLGRGMRLPFGRYTNIPILDSLEVISHERYEELLRKSSVLNEQFIDTRSRAVIRMNSMQQPVVQREVTPVAAPILVEAGGETATDLTTELPPAPMLATMDDYVLAGEVVAKPPEPLRPKPEAEALLIPVIKSTVPRSEFSLADITDDESFRQLGRKLVADPGLDTLRRVQIGAVVQTGLDGIRTTQVFTVPAADRVPAQLALEPMAYLREKLVDAVFGCSVTPQRLKERNAAERLVDLFLAGLGESAQRALSAYFDRASASLIDLVVAKAREFARDPAYEEVVELQPVAKVRAAKPTTTSDRYGKFQRGVGYTAFRKSVYAQDWFDSSTERDLANILDDSDDVDIWMRLQRGDLEILMAEDRNYNPDFVAVESGGGHWLVESKMDKEMESLDVLAKREAAMRWANHVSADPKVGATWRYLLVSEADVAAAKGDWQALKALGS